ncbi:MAG: outer membrane protein transport protein [Ignavibacteriales bacterium]|nr:outer membrane protein transport protein [Ignavibacteriales bacterium]
MKTIVRTSLVLALAAVLTTGLFANGLNLNGFGARSAAMGGAFVGLANDYTAVYWNPAGLALLKQPTFGLTGDILIPKATYTLGEYEMSTRNKMYPAGLLGFFTPIGENIVVGVGAYTLSGLGAAWENTGLEAALVSPYPPAAFTPTLEPSKWESFIGSITLAPSIAVKLSDMLYLGATFNINYGFFKTDQWGTYMALYAHGSPGRRRGRRALLVNFGQQTLNVKGWGFGATFGVLVKPAEWIELRRHFPDPGQDEAQRHDGDREHQPRRPGERVRHRDERHQPDVAGRRRGRQAHGQADPDRRCPLHQLEQAPGDRPDLRVIPTGTAPWARTPRSS